MNKVYKNNWETLSSSLCFICSCVYYFFFPLLFPFRLVHVLFMRLHPWIMPWVTSCSVSAFAHPCCIFFTFFLPLLFTLPLTVILRHLSACCVSGLWIVWVSRKLASPYSIVCHPCISPHTVRAIPLFFGSGFSLSPRYLWLVWSRLCDWWQSRASVRRFKE